MTIFYVEDACGDRFLHTVADADYEPAFRKHARWWVGHRTRPGAHRDVGLNGKPLNQPVRPCRVVVEDGGPSPG